MEVLTLLDWVKEELDQNEASEQLITDDFILGLIAKARIQDCRRAYDFLNRADDRAYIIREGKALGERVRIKMVDQTGTLEHFGYPFTYYLSPDNFEVRASDVLQDEADYTFNPFTMQLDFDPPLAGAPIVSIVGHIVDMRQVHYNAADALARKYDGLVDTAGTNYHAAANQIRRNARRRWGINIRRRGNG